MHARLYEPHVSEIFFEVEDPGWHLYDEVFREKIVAMGVKQWGGVDVQVFQETCGGLLRCNGRSLVGWWRCEMAIEYNQGE